METHAITRPRLRPLSRRLLAALGDDRLVAEAKRGNEAACEAIYDRYHGPLLAFCRHMLGSREDSEDALQHAFGSAFRSLRSDDRVVALKPWLYTIARNRCLSMLRARREHPVEEVEVISTAGLSEEVERRGELNNLLRDLARLPEQQRTALVLSEVADLNHSEIAHALDCEAKQVKAFIFQARSALIAARHARELPCAEVRERLATTTRLGLRRSELRRHLERCPGCAEYAGDVQRQRAMLAVALPVAPTPGLRESVLAAAGIGGGQAAGGGGLLAALGAHGMSKAVAITLATGGAVGGVAASDPALLNKAFAAVEGAQAGLEQRASSSPHSTEEGASFDSGDGSFERQAAKTGARESPGGASGNGSSESSSRKRSGASTPGRGRSRPETAPARGDGRARSYGREGSDPGSASGHRAHGAARSAAARLRAGGQRSGRGRGRRLSYGLSRGSPLVGRSERSRPGRPFSPWEDVAPPGRGKGRGRAVGQR